MDGKRSLACIEHRGKMRVFVKPSDLPSNNMFVDRCWFLMTAENEDAETSGGDARRIRADAWIFGKYCYGGGGGGAKKLG
jgi:hypothetical protein